MIQLTPYQTAQLRDAIESKAQFPIRNQADCVALSEKIENSVLKKVSSHTLRRFFGIVLWDGEFRIKTMDLLAHYLGYASIDAFVQELKTQADLSLYLKAVEEKKSDIYLYEKLILNSPSLESIMVVGANIREALVRNDIERVIELLRALEPMAKAHQRHSNALMLFAQYVAPKLYEIQDATIVKRFIETTPYVRLVLCQFVPILELQGGFGNHIACMLKHSSNHEHLAFGYSLLASAAWRDKDAKTARKFTQSALENREKLTHIHPILRGRIDFLTKIAENGTKTTLTASDFNPPKNQNLLYLHAILTEAVLLHNKTWCKSICESSTTKRQNVNNWIEQSILGLQEIALLFGNCGVWSDSRIREKLQMKKETSWPKDHAGIASQMLRVVEKQLA